MHESSAVCNILSTKYGAEKSSISVHIFCYLSVIKNYIIMNYCTNINSISVIAKWEPNHNLNFYDHISGIDDIDGIDFWACGSPSNSLDIKVDVGIGRGRKGEDE